MKRISHFFALLVVYCAFASAGIGCECKGKMRSFNVNVTLDGSMTAAGVTTPVEVHLIGANADETNTLENNTSMTAYWDPADPGGAEFEKVVFKLGAQKKSEVLSIDAPVWKRWRERGAMNLFILASRPVKGTDKPGNNDPRRRMIPLACENWDESTEDLSILVTRGGLKILTPPRPPK